MPVISDAAIAGFAKTAGLSGQSAAIAVAIALAESGGNTQAHNALPPDNSYGLWQINMLGSLGTERRSRFGLSSNEDLFDPAINARVMFALSNGGTNWKPWATYTRGTYLRYYSRGKNAVGTATLPENTSPVIPVASQNSLQPISRFFKLISTSGTWLRLGLIAAGAGLVFFGLLKITGDNKLSETTKSLGRAAIGLIPGGGTVAQGAKAAAKVVK